VDHNRLLLVYKVPNLILFMVSYFINFQSQSIESELVVKTYSRIFLVPS